MKTFISICVGAVLFFIGQSTSTFLIMLGIVAKYLCPFFLTVVSLPGRFIAFPDDLSKRSHVRITLGTIVSISAQSYVYLAYTAFAVSWTISATLKQANQFIIWPITFLAVIVPIGFSLNEFRKSVKETEHANKDIPEKTKQIIGGPEIKMFAMLSRATLITFLLTLIGFFIFSLSPKIMEIIYGWVPYVRP